MKKIFLALSASFLLFSGCGVEPSDIDNTTPAQNTPAQTMTKASDPTFTQGTAPNSEDEIAIMTTPQGNIFIRFFPTQAPKSVENFITHAKNGYYDTTGFHRVIPGFMIQGGDPKGNGTGGTSIWNTAFEDEFSDELQNTKASLAMANSGPNTNGSQFFINDANNTFLDGRHSVFGEVFSGMDVVNKIINVKTTTGDRPVTPVNMTIKIVKYSDVQ